MAKPTTTPATKKPLFDLSSFDTLLSSCKCDKTRVLAIFEFINSMKLKDIFARGFTLPDKMRRANVVSSVVFSSAIDNLDNLYDIVLKSLGVNSIHSNNLDVAKDFVIVFNSELTTPQQGDELLGFLSKHQIMSKQGILFYENIDDSLKFSFLNNNFYIIAEPYIKRVVQMFDLIQDRTICGTKTILQKEDSGFISRSKQWAGETISALTNKSKAESEAFLENNAHTVLTVPPNTNVLFPQADVTQIDKSYMRAVDWMLALFRLPSTKFFGESPSGFQNTGNLEVLNYEQSLDEIFESKMSPILSHIADLLGEEADITPVSFYKLQQLDRINSVRATTDSEDIIAFCDDMVEAISSK